MSVAGLRAALYARVSTAEQTCENQLLELRRYCEARGWTVAEEFIDQAVSGAKTTRPALDRLVSAARRRQVDAVVCWRLDRLGRSLSHLVTLADEFQQLGVALVSLGENIDGSTSAGRLMLGIMASLAEFERARIRERVRAGLARARRDGVRIGRPRQRLTLRELRRVDGLSVREAGKVLGVPASRVHRERARLSQNPPRHSGESTPINPSFSVHEATL